MNLYIVILVIFFGNKYLSISESGSILLVESLGEGQMMVRLSGELKSSI